MNRCRYNRARLHVVCSLLIKTPSTLKFVQWFIPVTKKKRYPSDRAVLQGMVLLNPFSSLGPVRFEKRCCTCKLSKFVAHFVTCYMASDKCKKELVCFYKHFLLFYCNSLRKQIYLSRSFSTSYVGKYHFFNLRVILETLPSVFLISAL